MDCGLVEGARKANNNMDYGLVEGVRGQGKPTTTWIVV